MKKYKVYISEVIGYVIEVEARDEQEADDKAGEIIENRGLTDGERMSIETTVTEIKS